MSNAALQSVVETGSPDTLPEGELSWSQFEAALTDMDFGLNSMIWRPLFVRNDKHDFAGLCKWARGAGVELRDTLVRQLEEWVRLKQPDAELSVRETMRRVKALLQNQAAEHFGLWVFYPWCRRLVHVVEQDMYAELRTARNLFKITPRERDALARKRIGVVGLSVGQAVAMTMATERVFGEIRLVDFDTLDVTNLNRIQANLADLGLPKVVIAARQIAELDPYLRVTCYTEGLNARNVEAFLSCGGDLDLVVEECDNFAVKLLLREHARARRIPVLMETSDRGMLDVERFDLEPDRAPFHGRLGSVDSAELGRLSAEQQFALGLEVTGVETLSTRMRASLLELRRTVTTWPQLASAVRLGGATVTDTARRILLGESVASGRYYVDLHELIPASRRQAVASPAPEVLSRCPPPQCLASYAQRLAPVQGAIDLPADLLSALVKAGTYAPSGGNSQPWHWGYGHRTLLLFKKTWGQQFLDFRELSSSAAAGAALENVRLEAGRIGLRAHVAAFPFGAEDGCVAAIRFTRVADQAQSYDPLADFIAQRHTNRRIVARAPLPAGTLDALRAAVASVPEARLHSLTGELELAEMAQVLGACQRAVLQNPAGFQQVMSEINWRDSPGDASSSIPVDSLELNSFELAGLRVCRDWATLEQNRLFGGGRVLEAGVTRAVHAASALCLITVPAENAPSYLAGGAAMQRAWLAATALGIGVQPLSPLPYVLTRLHAGDPHGVLGEQAAEFERLGQRMCRNFPAAASHPGVLLFRLAMVPPATSRSARLDIEHVLTLF